MSDFDGSRKHQNNPACTKCIRVFRILKLDTILKKEEPWLYAKYAKLT